MSDTEVTLSMYGPVTHSTERVTRVQFLRLSRWFTLALCGIALVLPLPFGRPGVWLGLSLTRLFAWQTLAGGVMGLAIGGVVALLITYWRPLRVIAEHIAQLVAWDTFLLSDFVATALLAALGEELLFRGALQPLIGLLPTALVFGLLHATSLSHIILAAVLGLWLGWLYQWTGSLWPPIAAHMALDLITGLVLAPALDRIELPSQGD